MLPLLSLHSPLSPDKGKQLMDEVARLLQVPPNIFVDVE
jgi:hypothetical protein